jgi:hypothetical protein
MKRCTCTSGRDFDGSEFGPCEYCEAVADEERRIACIMRDAARWRISHVVYPRSMDDPFGYFVVKGEDDISVGIQPHPKTGKTSVNACILGRGATEAEAIDSMFLSLDELAEHGVTLSPEIEAARALATSALAKASA